MGGFTPYAARWRPEAQAQMFTDSGTVSAGAGAFQLANTTRWGTPSDPFAGTGGANKKGISSWLSTVNHQLFVAPGYYMFSLLQTLAWLADADAPASMQPSLSGGRALTMGGPVSYPKFQIAAGGVPRWGVVASLHSGVTYVSTGDVLTPDVFFSGALPGALSSVWSSMKLHIIRLGA